MQASFQTISMKEQFLKNLDWLKQTFAQPYESPIFHTHKWFQFHIYTHLELHLLCRSKCSYPRNAAPILNYKLLLNAQQHIYDLLSHRSFGKLSDIGPIHSYGNRSEDRYSHHYTDISILTVP